MEALAGFAILAAIIAGLVWLLGREGRQRVAQADARVAGERQHRRSGDYPSACSWCKNTTLARRLLVFERVDGAWAAVDVLARLRECSDADVEHVAKAFASHQLEFRRFCSERCTTEFFAAANLAIPDSFSACDYCSTRAPSSLVRCPHCNAPRVADPARAATGAK